MTKNKDTILFNQYKTNWLYMLSEADYFNQCSCSYCLKLKHSTDLMMNYLQAAPGLKSFVDKCDFLAIEELVELYLKFFHSKTTCNIIIDVCNSMTATIQYYQIWKPFFASWHALIKNE